MRLSFFSKLKAVIIIVLLSSPIRAQYNLVQPTTITGTATPFTGGSTPSDLVGDPAVVPSTDPTNTTVASYSSGSLFNDIYIWNGIANTITMNFGSPVDITGVAIWNAFASGAYLNPGFLEPDHSVAIASFEFFNGGTSLGIQNINVLFPNDAFGEFYPFGTTYPNVTQIVMTVLTNHGGNETAMQEIAFNTVVCDNITVVAPNTTICLGQSASITGTSTNGGLISWNNGITNGVSFTPTSVGTITYTSSSSSASDCPATINITVTSPSATPNANIDQTVCEGGTINLSGTISGGATGIWSAPSGTFSNTNSLTSIYTPTITTGTVILTLTTAASGSCPAQSDDMVVTVNSAPTVSANNDQTICAGDIVTLNGSMGGGASSTTWSAPSGTFSSPSSLTSSYSPTITSGTINLTLTTNALAPCAAVTDIILITVIPIPTANANINQTICEGGTVTLAGVIGGGATSGTWSASSGSFSNANSLTSVYTPSITAGTVILTLTPNTTGICSGVPDLMEITLTPGPTVNANINQSVCVGGVIDLNGSFGGSATNALWTAPSGTFSDPNSMITTYTPTVTSGTINLTLTTNAPGSCAAVNDFLTVTINPLPSVNAGVDVIICPGESVTLSGSGAITYTWNNGIQNGVSFLPASSGAYTVTGTDNNGCIASDLVNVTIDNLPTINFSADNLTGCLPLTVNFTDNSTNTANCIWQFGDGASSNNCGAVSHVYTQPGCFTVTLTGTSLNGCVTSASTIDMICTEAYPNASFNANPNAITILNSDVSFDNTTTGATSYNWDFGDNQSSIQVSPNHNYGEQEEGAFLVILIAQTPFGCSDTARLILPVEDLLIYYIPNAFTPNGNEINNQFKPIFTSGFNPFEFEMIIFNRWGEQIFETGDSNFGWNGYYGSGSGNNECQVGIYTYKITFRPSDEGARKIITGHVNLIR